MLQFLYAIKPVRDAILNVDQSAASPEPLPAAEKEKWIKVESSRRCECVGVRILTPVVRLLRDLFMEMYDTETSAVVPQEDLARLAILPVDLISQRRDAIPSRPQVTIDTMPTVLSPILSPVSSGAATMADTCPPTPQSIVSSPPTTPRSASPDQVEPTRPSVLGKRASQDRDSQFGGSQERLRGYPTGESLVEMDSGASSPPLLVDSEGDALMRPRPAREGSLLTPGLKQLGITSPDKETESDWQRSVDSATASAVPTASSLPPRPKSPPLLPPRRTSMALVAAEKFGLQQDAAEILINVLAQLEYAFDKPSQGEATPITNLVQQ